MPEPFFPPPSLSLPCIFLLPTLHLRISRAQAVPALQLLAFPLKSDPRGPGTPFLALPCQLLSPGSAPMISIGHAVALAISTWHMVAPFSRQWHLRSLTRHREQLGFWVPGLWGPCSLLSQLSRWHHLSICSLCLEKNEELLL